MGIWGFAVPGRCPKQTRGVWDQPHRVGIPLLWCPATKLRCGFSSLHRILRLGLFKVLQIPLPTIPASIIAQFPN